MLPWLDDYPGEKFDENDIKILQVLTTQLRSPVQTLLTRREVDELAGRLLERWAATSNPIPICYALETFEIWVWKDVMKDCSLQEIAQHLFFSTELGKNLSIDELLQVSLTNCGKTFTGEEALNCAFHLRKEHLDAMKSLAADTLESFYEGSMMDQDSATTERQMLSRGSLSLEKYEKLLNAAFKSMLLVFEFAHSLHTPAEESDNGDQKNLTQEAIERLHKIWKLGDLKKEKCGTGDCVWKSLKVPMPRGAVVIDLQKMHRLKAFPNSRQTYWADCATHHAATRNADFSVTAEKVGTSESPVADGVAIPRYKIRAQGSKIVAQPCFCRVRMNDTVWKPCFDYLHAYSNEFCPVAWSLSQQPRLYMTAQQTEFLIESMAEEGTVLHASAPAIIRTVNSADLTVDKQAPFEGALRPCCIISQNAAESVVEFYEPEKLLPASSFAKVRIGPDKLAKLRNATGCKIVIRKWNPDVIANAKVHANEWLFEYEILEHWSSNLTLPNVAASKFTPFSNICNKVLGEKLATFGNNPGKIKHERTCGRELEGTVLDWYNLKTGPSASNDPHSYYLSCQSRCNQSRVKEEFTDKKLGHDAMLTPTKGAWVFDDVIMIAEPALCYDLGYEVGGVPVPIIVRHDDPRLHEIASLRSMQTTRYQNSCFRLDALSLDLHLGNAKALALQETLVERMERGEFDWPRPLEAEYHGHKPPNAFPRVISSSFIVETNFCVVCGCSRTECEQIRRKFQSGLGRSQKHLILTRISWIDQVRTWTEQKQLAIESQNLVARIQAKKIVCPLHLDALHDFDNLRTPLNSPEASFEASRCVRMVNFRMVFQKQINYMTDPYTGVFKHLSWSRTVINEHNARMLDELCMLTGRYGFTPDAQDKWGGMVMLLGPAACGKTIYLNWLRRFFHPKKVQYYGPQTEKTFGINYLLQAELCLMPEAFRSTSTMEQFGAFLKSLTDAKDGITAPVKYGAPETVNKVQTFMAGVGNTRMKLDNDSGAFGRRMFEFMCALSTKRSDDMLYDRHISLEEGHWWFACVRNYFAGCNLNSAIFWTHGGGTRENFDKADHRYYNRRVGNGLCAYPWIAQRMIGEMSSCPIASFLNACFQDQQNWFFGPPPIESGNDDDDDTGAKNYYSGNWVDNPKGFLDGHRRNFPYMLFHSSDSSRSSRNMPLLRYIQTYAKFNMGINIEPAVLRTEDHKLQYYFQQYDLFCLEHYEYWPPWDTRRKLKGIYIYGICPRQVWQRSDDANDCEIDFIAEDESSLDLASAPPEERDLMHQNLRRAFRPLDKK